MRTIIAKTFTNSSSSSSNSSSSPIYHHANKKSGNFQWMMLKKGDTNYKSRKDGNNLHHHSIYYDQEEEEDTEILAFSASSSSEDDLVISTPANYQSGSGHNHSSPLKKKTTASSVASNAVSKFRSAVMAVMMNDRRKSRREGGRLGPCVTGTIFGRRRGHVHLAFQVDPKSAPALLVELDMQTNTLVREMASGLVRIALECHKTPSHEKKNRLLSEPVWRAYCNGKKCGFATRRECGPTDWRLLRAVEPVSVGAGVLPEENKGKSVDNAGKTGVGGDNNNNNNDYEGDVMYMRAKFERVVGSKDSEAFYMLNPDGNGGPELSIYLLRV